MNHQHLVLHPTSDHPSLENWLRGRVPGLGRQQLESLFHQQRILVNQQAATPEQAVVRGDRIDIYRRYIAQIEPEKLPLEIVFEDPQLLVVNKAAGMPVHPGLGHYRGTLLHALAHYYEQSGQAALLREAVVHRLDKDTSGLMVLAKTPESKTALAQQFLQKSVHRSYLALVWGIPEPAEGSIDLPLGRHPNEPKRITTDPSRSWGKPALTHYQLVEKRQNQSLVHLRPVTGRTHQLRIHLHAIGHGIVGDTRYVQANANTADRLYLHAAQIQLEHPISKEVLQFQAPVNW